MRFTSVFSLLILATTVHADSAAYSAAMLERQAALENIRMGKLGALELADGILIENDGPAAGFSYLPNQEKLAGDIRAKVILKVDDPACHQATLLVAPGGDLQMSLNGQEVPVEKVGKTGNYWEKYLLPKQLLKKGANEVVLWGKGNLWIARAEDFAKGSRERPKHPGLSSKSSDGGKTWQTDRLGPQGDISGEYNVRLFLDQNRLTGSIVLPVVDVNNLANRPISRHAKPTTLQVLVVGTDNACRTFVRSGPTLHVDPKTWSNWTAFNGKAQVQPFAQVKVVLTGVDRLQSPKIEEIVLWTPDDSQRAGKLKVGEAKFDPLYRSSIPFEYEPFDHPVLKKLRQDEKLDDLVRDAKDELGLVTRLAGWSATRFRHPGHIGKIYPAWNALEILKPFSDGSTTGGFCQQFNLTFLQACESFGLPGRCISISAGDHHKHVRSGHEVVEIWSNQFQKWIYVDGQGGWLARDAETKVPLNLLELRERQLDMIEGKKHKPIAIEQFAETKFTWKDLADFPPFLELRMIPRSNFLQQLSPLPLNQGMRGWFWTGHAVYSDERSPAALLYGHRITAPSQWNWGLNRARIAVLANDSSNTVQVHLDSNTPGLAGYDVIINDGQPRRESAQFSWDLQAGNNKLDVWPVNIAGRKGIKSSIEIERQ